MGGNDRPNCRPSLRFIVNVVMLLLIFAGVLSVWNPYGPDVLADPGDTNLDYKVNYYDVENEIKKALRNEVGSMGDRDGW